MRLAPRPGYRSVPESYAFPRWQVQVAIRKDAVWIDKENEIAGVVPNCPLPSPVILAPAVSAGTGVNGNDSPWGD